MNEEHEEAPDLNYLLKILEDDDQSSLRNLAERALLVIERREHGVTRLRMAYILATLLFEEDFSSWHLDLHVRMVIIFVLWWLFIKGKTSLEEMTIVSDTCIRLFSKHTGLQHQHRNDYSGPEMTLIDKMHDWDAKCLIMCLQQGDKVGFKVDIITVN